jgi:hypothetical protein
LDEFSDIWTGFATQSRGVTSATTGLIEQEQER